MNKKLIIAVMFASVMMAGCGSSSDVIKDPPPPSEPRFEKVTTMSDTVEVDNQTGFEWVGSVGSAGGSACIPNPAPTDMMTEVTTAKDHCEALVFAGHDDWRVPTATENATFIEDMKSAGKTPFYANAMCPRLIGVDGETAVTVNTHNVEPVGGTTAWTSLLEMQGMKNFGVKCVRTK